MNHSKSFISLALLVFSLVFGACQTSRPQTQTQTLPDINPRIIADCVVSYFQIDSAPYITQQRHAFDPSSRSLKMTADEPAGTFTFALTNDQFAAAEPLTPYLSGLPASFVNQPLATAVFYSFTAGAGILDTAQWMKTEPVKIEGKWYNPIQIPTENGTDVTLYWNADQERVELVKIADQATESLWLLQSYSLIYSKEADTLIPRKIDVFDIENGLASKRLLIQFEYKSIR